MSTPSVPPTVGDFRRVLGRFVSGIAVVTAEADGTHHAMTVSSFTSVSLDPLLVLFCAERVARFHDAVLQAGQWGVSFLGSGGAEASAWFATRGRPLDRQLEGHPWKPGSLTGAALLDGAEGHLECRTTTHLPAGDHTVVVGEVLSVAAPDRPADPLVYLEGRYLRLGDRPA